MMKTLKQLKLIALAFFTISTFAQQGINYKALVKDNGGNIVANQNITIQFQIRQGAGMSLQYQETHNAMTDVNGIIIVNIGEGTPDSGDYGSIDWGSDNHFLNVQIDTGGGMTDMGTTQFMAVPYALQASNVTGLEALDESNGIGWRLIGRNPALHGNIGLNAVDLSYSPFTSGTRGATGERSVAMGYRTTASGAISTAIGATTFATGVASTSMGINTTAQGDYATAIGRETTAIGTNSLAIGNLSTSGGDYSIAMGTNTNASAFSAIALGFGTIATGSYSTAFGSQTLADGNSSTAMGANTTALGSFSTAMGVSSEALGTTSISAGYDTNAIGSYSIAMGRETTANGDYATAIGIGNIAFGEVSVALGELTLAEGGFSTAMGSNTTASGGYSNAMGLYTLASGDLSTAMGSRTVAESYLSTVIGRYNLYNLGTGNATGWVSTDPLFEVGNGGSNVSRSNALTVYKNGNVDVGNDMYVQGGLVHSSDRRLKTEITKLNYGLESILQLRPVSFYWKKDRDSQNQKSIGLIAQEVQPVIEELVREGRDKDKLLSLNYEGLIPVLINAFKEQQVIIDNLKGENQDLKSKFNNLDQRLKNLESASNQ